MCEQIEEAFATITEAPWFEMADEYDLPIAPPGDREFGKQQKNKKE
jgi:hypothetical protein